MKVKKVKNVPVFASWLLGRLSFYEDNHSILGDFEETYIRIAETYGLFKARSWIYVQILKSFPEYIRLMHFFGGDMIKNYIKIALRHIKKYKVYSIINIVGLTVGLMVTIILTLYVLDDISYDNFHENKENIYRLLSVENSGRTYAVTSGPLLPAAKKMIPEVKSATRMTMGNQTRINRVGADEETSIITTMILADSEFFDVFSFEILKGNNADALSIPGNVFLTSEIASVLFGDENPIGKPLQLNLNGADNPRVAGIVETPPHNSHIQFDIIASFIPESNPLVLDSWDNQFPIGYILVRDEINIKDVENKIIEIARNNDFPEVFTPWLQPLLDIHLGSADVQWDFNIRKNDRLVVNTLGAIGIMVLLVACINFVNLSTSRAVRRAREVGIRKVIGSNRKQIAFQFLGESVLMTVLSFSISLIIIKINAPLLGSILNKQLNLNIIDNFFTLLIFLVFIVFTGILSGIYPSIILSSFKPVDVLKGKFKSTNKGLLMRRVLVVFQFIVTTSLISAVMIIYTQIDFLKSRDMGYNRENVLAIGNRVSTFEDNFSRKLSELPGVVSTGRISQLPNANFGHIDVTPEGTNRTEGYQPVRLFINYDLFDMLRVPIVRGRNFSREFPADTIDNVIVNEELVRNAEWSDPIGKRIVFYYDNANINRYHVVGVVKDFHYGSPKQTIEPTIFHLRPFAFNLLVRLHTNRTEETIKQIERVHAELFPERVFNYTFLDDIFDIQFNNDRNLASNIAVFAGIAIFIACLGLLGLVSYTTEQRRKEVAVRKILGCSGTIIASLLVFDYLKWIALANVIAWPCVFFAMGKWLDIFVYKVSFTIIPYIVGGVVSIALALSIILLITIKAARSNPVDSLRYE